MKAWKQTLVGYEWLIHQIWYLEVESGEVIDPKPHLIPNVRAHLLFTPSNQSYSYDSGKDIVSGKGSHLLKASEHLLRLNDNPPLKRMGITFHPYALYCLNKHEVEGQVNCGWFDWLTPLFDDDFQQQLWRYTQTPEQLLSYIKQHLDCLGLRPSQDKTFMIAQCAVTEVERQWSDASTVPIMNIETLASFCSCSRRTLERSFKQVLGLTVKRYLQMMRLELLVLNIYAQEEVIDWTELTHKFGFSDQSHLIRTLKQQLGKTPSMYLNRRDLTIDIYGDFE